MKLDLSAVTSENVIGTRFISLLSLTIKEEMFCLRLTPSDPERFPLWNITLLFFFLSPSYLFQYKLEKSQLFPWALLSPNLSLRFLSGENLNFLGH